MRQYMQRIVPADEHLNHQIAETFATIGESDHAWTEKIWMTVFARDGSVQVNAGLGKYHNRNVIDGFAGISRETEQMTVRGSRQLDLAPEAMAVGPITYEIVEPLNSIRFTLDENEVIPVSFDITATQVLPCFLEVGDRQREGAGMRINSHLLRYHQAVTARGWLSIDGERVEFSDDDWAGFRDHSWGVRMDVGERPSDIHVPERTHQRFILQWSPMVFTRPDGSVYEIHHYLQSIDDEVSFFSGFENRPDGTQVPIQAVRDQLRYDTDNRRLLGGTMELDMGWGDIRTIEVEPMSDTGFHLGPANYFGFKGNHHGSYKGEEHLEGERYDDTSHAETVREVHQLRDCVIRVREGDAAGHGIFETIVIGEHERYGLDRMGSFL